MNIVTLIVLSVVALVGVALMRASVVASGARRIPRAPGLRGFFSETFGGTPYDLVSQDAQSALEEFSQDVAMAMAQADVEQWAKENGLTKTSKAILTTYPIPVNAAGYREFLGDIKYRSLAEKSVQLKSKTWQDGVAELAKIVEAPDFTGWENQPEAIALASKSIANTLIAELLEEGSGTGPDCWDGKKFFATDHPFDLFKVSTGTFSNRITGAGTNPTTANLALAKKNFRKIKAPNGKPKGLKMTHVLAPAVQEQTWLDILERDLIVESGAAVDNRHKNSVKLIISDELTDDLRWYPLALNQGGLGMRPWIVQDGGAPEEIVSDKSSHLYQTQLKVGVAYIAEVAAMLLLPQCIQSWAGTAP